MERGLAVTSKLDELRELGVFVEEIAASQANDYFAALRTQLLTFKTVRKLDASDIEREQVIEWLHLLPVDPAATVIVIWPDRGYGVRLMYGDFADNFDILWYPSSDDVWVFDRLSDRWLLELDHEELLTWWSLRTL